MRNRLILWSLAASLLVAVRAGAALEVPYIFQDRMVLQRQIKAPVWGKSSPNAEIRVHLGDVHELRTRADAEGRWKVEFSGLKTRTAGTTLTISSGEERIIIKDVLVGEVWFASGQSNLAHPLEFSNGGREETVRHSDPQMRVFTVGLTAAPEPQFNATGKSAAFKELSQWYTATDGKALRFGGTVYYFGKNLRAYLGEVPVGIIQSAVGGRPIQSYCAQETLVQTDLGRRQLAAWRKQIADWDSGEMERSYPARLVAWQASGEGQPSQPRLPMDPRIDNWEPTVLFNGMISPQIPYGFRGAIWYQGENNTRSAEEPRYYAETMANMVRDWRQRFGRDFTFLIVQLAGFRSPGENPEPIDPERVQYSWPFLQNQQRIAHEIISRSGLVVTNDIGEVANIHPGNKLDVGRRLARWAMHLDYDMELSPGGPLLEQVDFRGAEVVVSFRHAQGLRTKDNRAPAFFDLAGPDGKIYWAQARIKDGKVVVSSPHVPRPAQVRYAWSSMPAAANLVNDEGLPASCFVATKDDPLGLGGVRGEP